MRNRTPRAPIAIKEIASATPEQLRDGMLSSLRRMLRIRRDHFDELSPAGLWLLDRCIFARFVDCRAIGLEAEARKVLGDVRMLGPAPVKKATKRRQTAARDAR